MRKSSSRHTKVRSNGLDGDLQKLICPADTVTSTIVHPGGTVFATTSGQRFDPRELVRTASSSGSDLSDEEDATGPIRTSENMLKVWTL